MSNVMGEDRFAFLAHKIAGVIGFIILLPTIVYWTILILSNLGTFKQYFYMMESFLPSQFFYYNFASPILTYWLNKVVISYDRFGETSMLPINGILIFICYLLIILQIAYIILKG